MCVYMHMPVYMYRQMHHFIQLLEHVYVLLLYMSFFFNKHVLICQITYCNFQIRACHKMTTKLKREVILGSTSIIDPPDYVTVTLSLLYMLVLLRGSN